MRSLQEIEQELDNNVQDVFTTPSKSEVAEWKLWRSIFSKSVFVFERIMSLFKIEVENVIKTQRQGTLSWYFGKVKEFQGADNGNGFSGDSLIVDDSGALTYERVDSSRRVIEHTSLTDVDGTLICKVAKSGSNGYESLSSLELTAFGVYMQNIKYPGTVIRSVSLPPDRLKYDMDIYYNPIYAPDEVKAKLLLKMEDFKKTLGFNDKVFKQRWIDYLLTTDGVETIKLSSLHSKKATDTDYNLVDVVYELAAGYFNYQDTDAETNASTMNLIDVNTLY